MVPVASALALPAAIVMTASPHLTRPVRRLGRWLVGSARARRRPARGDHAARRRRRRCSSPRRRGRGAPRRSARAAAAPGSRWCEAASPSSACRTRRSAPPTASRPATSSSTPPTRTGEPLVVKVYGRDAHDAAAAVDAVADGLVPGGRVPAPLRAAPAGRARGVPDAVRRPGRHSHRHGRHRRRDRRRRRAARAAPLRRACSPTSTPELDAERSSRRIWALVERLHDRGIAHGQVDDGHLLVDGDELGVVDFRGATVAATETQRRTDEVQALVTTRPLLGEDARDRRRPRRRSAPTGWPRCCPTSSARRSRRAAPAAPRRRARPRRAARAGRRGRRRRGAGAAAAAPGHARLDPPRRAAGARRRRPRLRRSPASTSPSSPSSLHDASWWLVAVGFVVAQLPRLTQAVVDARRLTGPPAARPGVRAAARGLLRQPRHPHRGRPRGRQHPLLPAPRRAARRGAGRRRARRLLRLRRPGAPPGCLLLFTPASLDLASAARRQRRARSSWS